MGVRELQLQSLVPAVGEHGGFSSVRYPSSLEGPQSPRRGLVDGWEGGREELAANAALLSRRGSRRETS